MANNRHKLASKFQVWLRQEGRLGLLKFALSNRHGRFGCTHAKGGRRSRRRSCCRVGGADAVLDPQRAAADASDGLQHSVPLIRRAEPG